MNLNKTFVAVQDASRNMLALSDKEINQILLAVADAAINKTDFILSENQKDLERMPSTDPKYDRLKLTKRIEDKKGQCTFRCHRHYLRSPSQRQFRCILTLP